MIFNQSALRMTAVPLCLILMLVCFVDAHGCKFGDVRLTNGIAYIWNGKWESICGHMFWDNDNGATAVCNKLGYNRGQIRRVNRNVNGAFNTGRCHKVSDFPKCSFGVPSDRLKCHRKSSPMIGVTCDGLSSINRNSCGSKPVVAPCKYGDVKLTSGIAYIWTSKWEPICGHMFWDNNNGATAVCNKLGYTRGQIRRVNQNVNGAFNTGRCHKVSSFPKCSFVFPSDRLKCQKSSPMIGVTCDGRFPITKNSCGLKPVLPTSPPTPSPTNLPTPSPTNLPTLSPTNLPTLLPTPFPTNLPTLSPTPSPTHIPTSPPTECNEKRVWTKRIARKNCKKSSMRFGVKTCKSSYQKKLEVSLANKLYERCGSKCVYDYDTTIGNGKGAFMYQRRRKCYNYVTKGACLKMKNEIIERAKKLCPFSPPTPPPTERPCNEKRVWTEQIALTNCDESSMRFGVKTCKSSYQNKLEMSLANQLYGRCGSSCVYDYDSIIADRKVAFAYHKRRKCYTYVTEGSCFKKKMNKIIKRAKKLC